MYKKKFLTNRNLLCYQFRKFFPFCIVLVPPPLYYHEPSRKKMTLTIDSLSNLPSLFFLSFRICSCNDKHSKNIQIHTKVQIFSKTQENRHIFLSKKLKFRIWIYNRIAHIVFSSSPFSNPNEPNFPKKALSTRRETRILAKPFLSPR